MKARAASLLVLLLAMGRAACGPSPQEVAKQNTRIAADSRRDASPLRGSA
jgi:hypothetical protein